MTLYEWLEESGMKHFVFARKVGVNRTTLYFWLKNKTYPSYRNYLKIKEVTNGEVTFEEFFKA